MSKRSAPKKKKVPDSIRPYFSQRRPRAALLQHRPREIIFAQGDAADAVFYIKKGKVKVTVISEQGKEAVVAILGVDEFIGEGCLIGQAKRLATAAAITDCETMRVGIVQNPAGSAG